METQELFVELKEFQKITLINHDDFFQTYLIRNKENSQEFVGKFVNIEVDNFLEKFPKDFLLNIKIISNLFPLLFLKFHGISLTNFEFEQFPVIFTEKISIKPLHNFIQNESSDIPLNFNLTKKLINIYGIASAFLFLHKYSKCNIKLELEFIYETDKFYPLIDLLTTVQQKFQKSDTFSNDNIFTFGKIVYSIITGEKSVQGQSEFIEQFQNYFSNSIKFKRFKQLISECIYHNDQTTFEKIIDELKNDDEFKENINQQEYYEYICEMKEEEEKFFKEYSSNELFVNLSIFEKQELIGRGTYGRVYKVKSKETGNLYAAKILIEKVLNTFHREMIIHSQINHPSIVKFRVCNLNDFENNDFPTIIVDYMQNGSLYNLIEIEKDGIIIPFWDDTMKLINIYGIAKAMSYLHSKNIINRDLKPKNILLDEFLFPKLCDFGHASFMDLTNEKFTGSLLYTAPESLRESKFTKESDVYSFAIVVYDILENKIDFIFKNVNQLFSKILLKKYRPIINSKTPRAYRDLIKSCWDEDPLKRPSFDDILNKLKNDPGFITQNVNKELFEAYVNFIDQTDNKKFLFKKHSLQPIYNEYFKLKSMNDPLSKVEKTIDLSKYEVLNIIGQGGFGEVFSIKNKKTGQIFAAKNLSLITNNVEDLKKRIQFSREVTILSDINHPSIVRYFGYSPIDIKGERKPVIVIEMIKNGSLEKLIDFERNGIDLPFWNDTMRLINIYGIASAMSYLHSKGIIHRDLKPENILLNDFLFPKICDFGLSKYLDPDFSNSDAFGTVQFMAPEIFSDNNYSKSSDVYSFGLTVYEILTTNLPFPGFTNQQIIYKILFKKERPNLNNSIPKIYKELITECWNQDPSKRPSFNDIVNQLKTNEKFITENVDKELFQSYIEFIENGIEINPKFEKISLKTIEEEFEFENSISLGEGFVDVNNYEINNQIEKNESMTVYDVTEQKTGTKFTATVSNYIEKFNKEELLKLSEEVKQLSSVKNPTIHKFIGISFIDFNHQKKPVIINEQCNRKTLFDVLENERNENPNPNWNNTKKLIVIYGIAYGMSLLHLNGILHPNLNPKNIFVDELFHPKLSEIGYYINPKNTRNASSRSSSQIRLSYYFPAPEILKSNMKTEKSDIYSFSLIVYEIMKSEYPFKNIENPKFIYSKIINEGYRPPFNKQIPEIYKQLIEECWMQTPSYRPSFPEIVNKLELNSDFLMDEINKDEYFEYIKSVKNQLR